MTSEEAYPRMPSYDQRALQRFTPGDRVTVGPAYRTGGGYALDSKEGEYLVVGVAGLDYFLARDSADSSWSLVVRASRLQLAR